MSNTMEDVRRFAGADQGLSVASFGRPDQSVHSTVVSAGVMDHPVTGERVVALVKHSAGKHSQTPSLALHPERHHRLPVGPDADYEGFDPSSVLQLIRDVFISAGGTHQDWDEYDRVMAAERRAAVFIHPTRITGVGQP